MLTGKPICGSFASVPFHKYGKWILQILCKLSSQFLFSRKNHPFQFLPVLCVTSCNSRLSSISKMANILKFHHCIIINILISIASSLSSVLSAEVYVHVDLCREAPTANYTPHCHCKENVINCDFSAVKPDKEVFYNATDTNFSS